MKGRRSSFRSRPHFALLLIDVINDLEFPQGESLLRHALPAARRIAALKKRARASNVPTVYVNDNFGRWQSDFRQQVEHCQQERCRGRELAILLEPSADDFFVLKPKHSGFFSSPLDLLLNQLGARRLILTGFSSEICVLYTANDAYMRDFEIFVPPDCVAAETRRGNHLALQQMQRWLKADIRMSTKIRFS